MAMAPGGRRGAALAAINMTPMIDVLLVLLIIFMVVQAGPERGLSVAIPADDADTPAQPAGPEALVLEVDGDGAMRLNRQPLDAGRLVGELRAVFDPRPRKVLFVDAAETVPYGEVVSVVDRARMAGVEVVALMPRDAP